MIDLRNVTMPDLMSELVIRIVKRDGRAAVDGLVALLEQMARHLPERERFALAEKLRDLADATERMRVIMRI